MHDTSTESLIPYDSIVQEALLTVVGRTLKQVEANGGSMPGNHHFYISFKTKALGVSVPQKLSEKFPEEMTIVLQHRFSDLKVGPESFSVLLSFDGIPSMITIPYLAITAFVDPSVDFGLQFHVNDDEEDGSLKTAERGQTGNVIDVDFRRPR